MVEAVETAGVTCFPFQGIMRLRCADLKARIDTGEIGDLVVMHQTSRWSIAEDWFNSGTPGWFVDPRTCRAARSSTRHLLDRLVQVAGRQRDRRGRGADGQPRAQGHRVEDWGMATFTFANGVIATLEASWTINAPRKTGPSPKHNSVVRLELSARAARSSTSGSATPGRAVLAAGRRRLGVRAAVAPAVRAGAPFPPNPPHRLPGQTTGRRQPRFGTRGRSLRDRHGRVPDPRREDRPVTMTWSAPGGTHGDERVLRATGGTGTGIAALSPARGLASLSSASERERAGVGPRE